MRLYLDDVRPHPPGWLLVKTARECIDRLAAGDITEISLDHDLGYQHYPENGGVCGDGYCGCAVAEWLVANKFSGTVSLHTMNPVGRERMTRILAGEGGV